jgi:hypothetical protein
MKLKMIAPLAALIPLALFGVAEASPALPIGTLAVNEEKSDLVYGGQVAFDTTVTGRISNKAQVYILNVCWNEAETVTYQRSNHNLAFTFPLVDQGSQYLQWNGEAAQCEAWLVYRIDGSRSSLIEPIAKAYYNVGGTS